MRALNTALLASSFLLVSQAPIFAAPPEPVAAIGTAPIASSAGIGVEPQPVAEKAGLICRKMDPPTGIRVGTRDVCLTQHQWDMQMHQSQTNVAAAQRKAAQ